MLPTLTAFGDIPEIDKQTRIPHISALWRRKLITYIFFLESDSLKRYNRQYKRFLKTLKRTS